MTQEPPKRVPRDAAGRNQQWGMLDWAATDTRSEPDTGNAALRGYATIPAPCYRAARAEGVKPQIGLPFAALHEAGRECWIGWSGCPTPVRCAGSGVRPGGRAAPDRFVAGLAVLNLPSEVAADQPPWCASSAGVEITLLCGYLHAD